MRGELHEDSRRPSDEISGSRSVDHQERREEQAETSVAQAQIEQLSAVARHLSAINILLDGMALLDMKILVRHVAVNKAATRLILESAVINNVRFSRKQLLETLNGIKKEKIAPQEKEVVASKAKGGTRKPSTGRKGKVEAG